MTGAALLDDRAIGATVADERPVRVNTRHSGRLYIVVAALLAVWAAILLAVNLTVIPSTYWYSYYAIDYSLGFVRRGLAGELTGLLPGDDAYFKEHVGRWVSSGAYFVALAALAWWLAVRSGRSERRLQLAVLVAVLPFGFAFGLLQAGATLFGATAMIVFAIAIARAETARSVRVASALFGVCNAVLALVHEAIPLLFGLGVIAALAVLANHSERRGLWIDCALALGPGLLATVVVAAFGKHGIGDGLCALIPHAQINNPLRGQPAPTLGQVLHGYRYWDDYHDWACRNITPFYNRSFIDGMHYVGRLGAPGMTVNTVFGAALLALTVGAIGSVSGVPPRRLWAELRRHWVFIVCAACLTLPVFMTGVDWVRWWVSLTLDIGVVYLLYTGRQSEVDAPPTGPSTRAFVAITFALMLLPAGAIPAFLAPLPL